MAEGLGDLKARWQELNAYVEDLAREREHYFAIFERTDDAYLLTDARGVIEDANGAAVDLFERRRRDLRGRLIAALIAPARRQDFRRRIAALLAGAAPAASWRTRVGMRASGELTVGARRMGQPPSGIGWVLRPCR